MVRLASNLPNDEEMWSFALGAVTLRLSRTEVLWVLLNTQLDALTKAYVQRKGYVPRVSQALCNFEKTLITLNEKARMQEQSS